MHITMSSFGTPDLTTFIPDTYSLDRSMHLNRLLAGIVLLLISSATVQADVRLPSVLGSHMVLQQGKPVHIWGWADPGESVTVSFAGQSEVSEANEDGKWMVQLAPLEASSEPAELRIKGNNEIVLENILVGEVWLCSGQSNMEWSMAQTEHGDEEIPKATSTTIRLFNVQGHINKPEPQDDAPGSWQVCSPESVRNFSGVGYHFGKSLQTKLDVPIGLIGSNWGGTQIEPWTPMVGLEQVESLKANAKNGGIYNGMIHPLAPFTFRGVIWYQGESNCLNGDTDIYTDRTVAMVKGWQTVFQQDDLSFYFVQIAPFPYESRFKQRNENLNAESLPRFWDAQTACLKAIPNSGMVVVTDITGDVNDIHPRNKRDVGDRLARWALAKNYGDSSVVFSGPLYQSMSVENGEATLRFEHIGSGLTSLDGEPLTHFMISGDNQTFVEAEAKIEGDTIVVRSKDVDTPVAVRFAWQETAVANFGNKDGLPAAPFRTDAW